MDFLKKVVQLTSARYIALPLEILTSVIIVRTLGIDKYGVYTIAFIIPNIIVSFGSFGVGPAIVYFFNKRNLKISELFITFFLIGTLVGIIYFLGLSSISGLIQNFFLKNKLNQELMLIAFFSIIVILPQKYIRHLLRASYKIKEFALVTNILPTIIRSFLVILIIFVFKQDIYGLVWVSIITEFSVSVGIFIVLRKSIWDGIKRGNYFLNFTTIKKMYIFGLKGHLGGTIQKANDQLPLIVLTNLFDTASVGSFSLATKIINAFGGLKKSIGAALSPKIAKSNYDEIKIFFPYLIRLLFISALLLGIGLVIFAPILIKALYGDDMEPVTILVYILSPGTLLFPVVLMNMVMFSQSGYPLKKATIRLVGFAINVIFLIFFIRPFGINGAALSISAGNIGMLIYSTYLIKIYFKASLRDIIILKLNDFDRFKSDVKILLSRRAKNQS